MAELKLQRHISPQCTSEITACGALSSYEQEYKNIQALDTLKDYRLYLVPHVRTKKKTTKLPSNKEGTEVGNKTTQRGCVQIDVEFMLVGTASAHRNAP